MNPRFSSSKRGAALVIVLAFLVILSGLVVAYLSRTTTDRQLAHGSFNAVKADELAKSALDLLVGDLKQEIVTGSSASTVSGYTIYTPTSAANMLPTRSGNPSGNPDPIPNLVKRSIRADPIPPPGVPSRASAVNSESDISFNGRSVTSARWNDHYLIPRLNAGNTSIDTTPVSSFVAPDWVILTAYGPKAFTIWDGSLADVSQSNHAIGRYAYAVYNEAGLIDANVAGFPSNTTAGQSGRGGSVGYADLTPSTGINLPQSQIDNLVGWRNYASVQPDGSFASFTFTSAAATRYFDLVFNNTGFLAVPATIWYPQPGQPRTDQAITSRRQLIDLRSSLGFTQDALQYLSTFSREVNSPSNSNFLSVRVGTAFTRFDGTTAVIGEPLVKARFPLTRLAWVTYKGPSASLPQTDPVIVSLLASGVSLATIQAGTAANILACFGLSFVGNDLWTYAHGSADSIFQLDQVAAANREPDFFELLQAAISAGSIGQDSGGGVTGAQVFPDIHMGNKTHHILSIGAAIIDQADPDSIPTRIQFNPSGTFWTAYGVESLPYITEIYPLTGKSPDGDPNAWATYLLFQLWNPHQNVPPYPPLRLRIDGGLGLFKSGNGEVWNSPPGTFFQASGQSVVLNTAATFAPTPAPLTTANAQSTGSTAGTYAPAPTPPASATTPYLGFRLPDVSTSPVPLPSPTASPIVTLQAGASVGATAHPLNATMEVDIGGGNFVDYNRFIGINDPSSWIKDDPMQMRTATSTGKSVGFSTAQLTAVLPASLMKSDPRASRFGIFHVRVQATNPRIIEPLWSTAVSLPNGYGGVISDPGGDIEHAPKRFAGNPFFPATLALNNGPTSSTRTAYSDNNGVIRPADACYPDPTSSARLSTPYTAGDYQPIMLNRPFRSVGELGYAFRDLPWKTVDLFSDTSADAGLLDIFCINDGLPIVAGHTALNTGQPQVLQSLLAGALINELNLTSLVSGTGSGATTAPVMGANLASATSAAPLTSRSGLLNQPNLPKTILPVPLTGSAHDQRVKTRREVVARSLASVTQTRTWNLLIDLIAQSGRYPPTATGLTQFVVEGEKRYWLHVSIDRFTGEVVDQQLEAVQE